MRQTRYWLLVCTQDDYENARNEAYFSPHFIPRFRIAFLAPGDVLICYNAEITGLHAVLRVTKAYTKETGGVMCAPLAEMPKQPRGLRKKLFSLVPTLSALYHKGKPYLRLLDNYAGDMIYSAVCKTTPQQQEPHGITAEHVAWAYRLFLNREPESDSFINEKLDGLNDIYSLTTTFMLSQEFQDIHPDLAYTRTPTRVIKELPEGPRIWLDLSDVAIGLNILRDTYENAETLWLKSFVKPGFHCVDVGANIGYFSLHAAHSAGEKGHVTAIEPLPSNAELLRKSIEENGFTSRMTLIEGAADKEKRDMCLIYPRDSINCGGAYIQEKEKPVPVKHISLPLQVNTLDSYVKTRPVNLLKIDVEGAEFLALSGAQKILKEDKPVILMEINPRQLEKVSQTTPAELVKWLENKGYTCHALTEQGKRGTEISEFNDKDIINVVFVPGKKAAKKKTAKKKTAKKKTAKKKAAKKKTAKKKAAAK